MPRKLSEHTVRYLSTLDKASTARSSAGESQRQLLRALRAPWDVLITLVVLMSAVVLALRLSGQAHPPALWWTLALDALLIVDVVVNAATALRMSQLVVDVTSALPWHLFGVPLWAEALGALKLARLPRTLRRLEVVYRVRTAPAKLLHFGLLVALSSHFLACGFLALAPADCGDHDYVTATYWVVMTMTTVGYGDVALETREGRLFSIGTMVVGAAVFAYGVSDVVSLVTDVGREDTEEREQLEAAVRFATRHRLPPALRSEVCAFVSHRHHAPRLFLPVERELLDGLPALTRTHVAQALSGSLCGRMPFLADLEPDMVLFLAERMESVVLAPGQTVFEQGDAGGDCMFSILAGRVAVLQDGQRIGTLTAGQYFGEHAVLERAERVATVRADEFTTLYRLTRDDITDGLRRFPASTDLRQSFSGSPTPRFRPPPLRRSTRRMPRWGKKRSSSASSSSSSSATSAATVCVSSGDSVIEFATRSPGLAEVDERDFDADSETDESDHEDRERRASEIARRRWRRAITMVKATNRFAGAASAAAGKKRITFGTGTLVHSLGSLESSPTSSPQLTARRSLRAPRPSWSAPGSVSSTPPTEGRTIPT